MIEGVEVGRWPYNERLSIRRDPARAGLVSGRDYDFGATPNTAHTAVHLVSRRSVGFSMSSPLHGGGTIESSAVVRFAAALAFGVGGYMAKAKTTEVPAKWRNRIISYGIEPADQFLANEANWRIHPKPQQDALTGVLNEVGWVQEVIVNKRTSALWGKDQGVETLVDGHLRVALAISAKENVPVKYVDLDPGEEALILAAYDPIAAMAATDAEKLDALLREVNSGEAGVQAMLARLAVSAGLLPTDDPYAEWQGMPAFEQENLNVYHTIKVHFNTADDLADFARLIGQTITDKTTSIHHPTSRVGASFNRIMDES